MIRKELGDELRIQVKPQITEIRYMLINNSISVLSDKPPAQLVLVRHDRHLGYEGVPLSTFVF